MDLPTTVLSGILFETMNATCPGCRTELGPNDTSCPICLRPRSRHEMMAALNVNRRADEARRKRPLHVALAVFLCAAGAFAFKQARRLGLGTRATPPPTAAPAPAAVSIQPPAPAAAPPEPENPQPTQPPKPPVEAEQPLTAPPMDMAPAPDDEPSAGRDWSLDGTVFDLLSLRPAANAKLSFENRASGEVFTAKTDARGRYKISLPRLADGGYWVSVNAKGYDGQYLEQSSPPFASRTRAGREEAAYEATQSQILHVPVFLDKEVSLEYDLALLPAR